MSVRSPLHESELQKGAVFAEYHSREVAENYGSALLEYNAVRDTVGVLDLSYLGKLRVTGKDRVRYLHNMVSNDIKNLKSSAGCYATLLTHQGRIESDLYIYAFDDFLLLEIPPAGRQQAITTLKKYIVADAVEIEDRTDQLCVLSLQGPASQAVMERTVEFPLSGLALLHHRIVARPAGDWILVHRDRAGYDGFDLWLNPRDAGEVWRRWVETEKVVPVGHQALDWLRTEAGIPWYGVDMDDRSLPMEFGLSSAVSLTKGCYRGQEIVARVFYRGNLDRRLGALVVQHDHPPAHGSEVRFQGAKVGEVTSAVFSPRLHCPLALCTMKSQFLTAGTLLDVVYGESVFPAQVISLPLLAHSLA